MILYIYIYTYIDCGLLIEEAWGGLFLEGGTLRGPHFYSGFGRFQTFYMNIWGW